MKRSKPISSSKISSRRDLRDLQRAVGGAIMSPLSPRGRMRPALRPVADAHIRRNDRLSGFERLEIYNRQYWFRLIDCLYDDYPGLRALLGERRFNRLAKDYLAEHPSTSFTLRNLGQYLVPYLENRSRGRLALDMARLEWARIVAFDGEARPVVTADELLDSRPGRLRLALQPYLSLLALRYPLDDYLMALKRLDTQALRGEASNAVTDARVPHGRRLRRPAAEPVWVAVHRMENSVYYKRLTREQFLLLGAIRVGKTLQQSCALVTGAGADDVQRWFNTWASFGWFCRR